MEFPIKHLSYSAMMQYLECKYMFHKKYIRFEYDENTWMGTVIGNGLHYCAERFFTTNLDKWDMVKRTYIMEQVHKFNKGELILNDKNVPDVAVFEAKLKEGLDRVIPLLDEYIKLKSLYDVVGAEVTLKVDLAGPDALPFKAKIDLITKDDTIIDWKCVKALSKGETLSYTLQATAYALAFEAHRGHLPKEVIFVEFLRTGGASNAQKVADYELKLAHWTGQGSVGRKPSKPRLQEGEEKQRMQEIVVPITEWKIEAFMLLYGLICQELNGTNLMAEGTPLPSLVSKFEPIPSGWIEFCKQHLGFDPYSGEVDEGVKATIATARALIDATKDLPRPENGGVVKAPEGYDVITLPPLPEKDLQKIDKPVYTLSIDDLPF